MADVFENLSAVQADGLACVACGRLYTHSGAPHVPVGRTRGGDWVCACVGECAEVATDTSAEAYEGGAGLIVGMPGQGKTAALGLWFWPHGGGDAA